MAYGSSAYATLPYGGGLTAPAALRYFDLRRFALLAQPRQASLGSLRAGAVSADGGSRGQLVGTRSGAVQDSGQRASRLQP